MAEKKPVSRVPVPPNSTRRANKPLIDPSDKLAYYKDNIIDPTDEDQFDPNVYYYNRQEKEAKHVFASNQNASPGILNQLHQTQQQPPSTLDQHYGTSYSNSYPPMHGLSGNTIGLFTSGAPGGSNRFTGQSGYPQSSQVSLQSLGQRQMNSMNMPNYSPSLQHSSLMSNVNLNNGQSHHSDPWRSTTGRMNGVVSAQALSPPPSPLRASSSSITRQLQDTSRSDSNFSGPQKQKLIQQNGEYTVAQRAHVNEQMQQVIQNPSTTIHNSQEQHPGELEQDQEHEQDQSQPPQQQSEMQQGRQPQNRQQTQKSRQEPDPYGLLGLLRVLKLTNRDLNMLASGTDLTTLGLNLSSPDVLYATFASPFSDRPLKREPEYQIPSCYYIRPPLPPPTDKMSLFSDETLFYIFYSMPRDALQLAAAAELQSRDWSYHSELKLWFQRPPGTSVPHSNSRTINYEHGAYIYFDIQHWEKRRKANFRMEYDKLFHLKS